MGDRQRWQRILLKMMVPAVQRGPAGDPGKRPEMTANPASYQSRETVEAHPSAHLKVIKFNDVVIIYIVT